MTEKKQSLKGKVEKTRAPRRKSYVLDLRVHSPASLGYLGIDGIDTAPAMVRLAKVKGLDVIALTDFYSADFIERVSTAAEDTKLTVIPGTSLRCKVAECDDIVLVCLFPESYGQQEVETFLRDLKVPEKQFGNEKYILTMDFKKILKVLEKHGGIGIPSRVDKTPHRMRAISTLVEKYGFRTFDLAYTDTRDYFKQMWPKTAFNLYSFSNASALAQVGSRNAKVKLPTPSFASIRDVAMRDLG